jgi:hypothetical protein
LHGNAFWWLLLGFNAAPTDMPIPATSRQDRWVVAISGLEENSRVISAGETAFGVGEQLVSPGSQQMD